MNTGSKATTLITTAWDEADTLMLLGWLATAVTHEVNNPLVYVIGNVDCAVEEMQRTRGWLRGPKTTGDTSLQEGLEDAVAGLNECRNGAARIGLLAQALGVFGNPERRRTGPIQVVNVIRSVLMLCHTHIKRCVNVEPLLEEETTPEAMATEPPLALALVSLFMAVATAFPERSAGAPRMLVEAVGLPDNVLIRLQMRPSSGHEHMEQQKPLPTFVSRLLGHAARLAVSMEGQLAVADQWTDGKGALQLTLPRLPAQDTGAEPS